MSAQTWIPEPSEATAPFFEGARDGKLRLQRCDACGAWAWPAITRCAECGSAAVSWAEASGKGTVYSHALLQRVYHPRHEGHLPLILAQVDLAEGIRVMTNLVDVDPEVVRVGDAVVVAFETFPDGGVLPVFKPA
ncbi:MAG: OB-fold domain-containing protein [Pseudomonadales bacterium]|jgi:uncharacterized OB-fold protein